MEKEKLIIENPFKDIIPDEKFYKYDDNHNPNILLDYWYQNAPEGKTLFVVFYTLRCQWNRCLGCNLPSKSSSKPVSAKNLIKQIDYILGYVIKKNERNEIKKIILSNNGSMFDKKTFHSPLLNYLFLKLALYFPNLKKVTIETRPEYITPYSLEIIDRVLNELRPKDKKIKIEIAIGFEIFDEKKRNRYYKKGLSFKMFEKFAELIGKYGYEIKTYFMLKPLPDMTEEEGKQDIFQAIDYIKKISDKYNVKINIHLNPTYVARDTELEKAFFEGRFSPPYMNSLIECLIYANQKGIEIFAGLYDEGLAVEGGTILRTKDLKYVPFIEEFNHTQDITKLKKFYEKHKQENPQEEEQRTISEKELVYIEEKAKDIIVITPTLENDIDVGGEICKVVEKNLQKGKKYRYVLPLNKLTKNAKKRYEQIHRFEEGQVEFYLLPEDEFIFTSETVIYNIDDSKNVKVLEWKPDLNIYIKIEGFFKDKIIKNTKKILKNELKIIGKSKK